MPTNTTNNEVTETPVTAPVIETCEVCTEPVSECECSTCRSCAEVVRETCGTCDCCESDCSCWYCNSCAESHSENTHRCDNCERCSDACECSYCESCENSYSSGGCGECNNCDECCECSELYFKMPLKFHEGRDFKINKSKRMISVEIEVSTVQNTKIADTVRNWSGSIVTDGSVSGDKPFEINTAPASGDLFLKQIDEICKTLRDNGGKANASCGLHVHIDARKENFFYLKKLAYLYSKIEDALFSIVAPSRKESTYSQPCGPKLIRNLENQRVPKDVEKTIVKNIYGADVDIEQKKGQKYDSARYSALNLHSWVFRGTVECRMHHGTVNATKIKNWGMLWAGILDFAEDNSEMFIKNMKGDSLSCLLSVCQNDTVRAWVVERHNQFNGQTSDADVDG